MSLPAFLSFVPTSTFAPVYFDPSEKWSESGLQLWMMGQRLSQYDLMSLFGSDGLLCKLLLLVSLVISVIAYFKPLSWWPSRNNLFHHYLTVSSLTLLLMWPMGSEYFVPVAGALLGTGMLAAVIYLVLLFAEDNKLNLLWIVAALFLLFISLYEPDIHLTELSDTICHVDSLFITVCTVVLLLMAVMLLFGIGQSIAYHRNKWMENDDRNGLLLFGFITWAFAFLIFFVGTYHGALQHSLLTCLLRPAFNASKTFILGDALFDISDDMKGNGLYMGLMSLSRLMAFYVSARVVFRLLGARIRSLVKLSVAHCHKSPLYVFFGVEEASKRILESIPVGSGEKPLALFVDVQDDDPIKQSAPLGFSSLVTMFAQKRETYVAIRSLQRRDLPSQLIMARKRFEQVNPATTDLSSLGLSHLERLMGEASRVEFFFMSDDEDANISSTRNLSQLLDHKQASKYTIHCQSRLNSTSQLLQFDKIRINIVDSCRLAIDLLHKDEHALLSQYVDFDPKGRCTTPLRSLVIGMGHSGLESIKYLYQYGAFLGEGEERSPFVCDVIDEHMDKLEGDLYAQMPILEEERAGVKMNLMNMKAGSKDFWHWLDENLADLHVIFLTMGDGENILQLADDLHSLALRKRKEHQATRPLSIFVRTRTNRSALQVKMMSETFSRLHPGDGLALIPLGEPEKLYDYGNVTNHEQMLMAEHYYFSYQHVTRTLNGGGEPETWAERRSKCVDTGRLEHLLEFLRMEQQDMNCEFHRRVKIDIVNRVLAQMPADEEGKRPSVQELAKVTTKATLDTETSIRQLTGNASYDELLYNLSIMEHLRWNAAHETQGFLYSEDVKKQDRSLLRLHPCLKEWSKLTEIMQLYDYAVLATTLKIEKQGRYEEI